MRAYKLSFSLENKKKQKNKIRQKEITKIYDTVMSRESCIIPQVISKVLKNLTQIVSNCVQNCNYLINVSD